MKRIIGNIWISFLLLKNFLQYKKELIPENLKSILIIELSRMGDVVSMIYAVLCLMKNFPTSTFSFVIDERYQNLLEKLLFYNSVDLSRVKIYGFSSTDTLKGLRLTKKKLDKVQYDLICSMSPSFRNGFLALSLKSTFKIGFFRSNSIYTPFLEKNRVEAVGIRNFASKSFLSENIEERGLKICSSLGLNSANSQKKVNLTKVNPPVNFNEPYIIIHPFAGWKYRSWNYLNYAQLIKNILARIDVNIFVIGSLEEKLIGEKLCNLVESPNVYPIFEEKLDTILNLIPHAELFIGNDSGPLHLASIFDVPVIGIYGPAPPDLTAPRKKGNYYFYKKLECSPCKQIRCIRPEDTCTEQVTVDEVTQKVFEYLKNLKINE